MNGESLFPFRRVVSHREADDRLECGHVVPAHGLVAKKRRCHWCADAFAEEIDQETRDLTASYYAPLDSEMAE